MLTKSQLAASIGCGYTIFRRYLRALERGNRHFTTGRKQYVTAQQEAYIRDFFAHLPALESFPEAIVWPNPAATLPQPTPPQQ
jgi:hypothetical protein